MPVPVIQIGNSRGISIPDLITSAFFLFVLPYLSWLCFVLVQNIFAGDAGALEALGLMFFVAFEALFLYLLIFKFKILRIDDRALYAFYPLLNKRKSILWEDFQSIDAQVIKSWRTASYRKIVIKGKRGREKIVSISLSDIEFENFNSLSGALKIPKIKQILHKIDLELAYEEKSSYRMYAIASVFGFLFMLYKLFFADIKSLSGMLIFLGILAFLSVRNICKVLWMRKVLSKKSA